MPSLSLLRRGSKQHEQQLLTASPQTIPRKADDRGRGQQADAGFGGAGPFAGPGIPTGTGTGTGTGKRERKSSKRDFFGGLLGRSRSRTPARGTGAESPTKLPVSPASFFFFSGLFPVYSYRIIPPSPLHPFRVRFSVVDIQIICAPVVLFPTFLVVLVVPLAGPSGKVLRQGRKGPSDKVPEGRILWSEWKSSICRL